MSGVIVITGGSRGIGAATARRAAQRGFDVVVNYASNAEAAALVVAEVEAPAAGGDEVDGAIAHGVCGQRLGGLPGASDAGDAQGLSRHENIPGP